jgi:ketosteroid isomerase-like protein
VKLPEYEAGILADYVRDTSRAMSQENVEIVRRTYEAMSRDGLDAAVEHVHPDFEYDLSAAIGPYAGIYYGRETVRGMLEDFLAAWEYMHVEPEDFIEVGDDRVLVLFRVRARGKGSGIDIEARPTAIWTVRDGQLVRGAVYNDRAEALEAAGLSEQDAHADS